MKKEYIKPEIAQTKFKAVEAIALSMTAEGTGNENDVDDPY